MGLSEEYSTDDFDFPIRCLGIESAFDLFLNLVCLSGKGLSGPAVVSRGVKLGKFPKFGNPGNESLIPVEEKIDLSSGLNLAKPKWLAKLG